MRKLIKFILNKLEENSREIEIYYHINYADIRELEKNKNYKILSTVSMKSYLHEKLQENNVLSSVNFDTGVFEIFDYPIDDYSESTLEILKNIFKETIEEIKKLDKNKQEEIFKMLDSEEEEIKTYFVKSTQIHKDLEKPVKEFMKTYNISGSLIEELEKTKSNENIYFSKYCVSFKDSCSLEDGFKTEEDLLVVDINDGSEYPFINCNTNVIVWALLKIIEKASNFKEELVINEEKEINENKSIDELYDLYLSIKSKFYNTEDLDVKTKYDELIIPLKELMIKKFNEGEKIINKHDFLVNEKEVKKAHLLKIKDIYFDKVRSREKTFEVRENDRDFKVGELVQFAVVENGLITNIDSNLYEITYVLKNYDSLKENTVVFSIKKY